MAVVKKTWLIDPVLLNRARKILGVKTEAEAITQALREFVRQHKPASRLANRSYNN